MEGMFHGTSVPTRIANLGCAEDWPSSASIGIVLDNALQRLQRCGLFYALAYASKLAGGA